MGSVIEDYENVKEKGDPTDVTSVFNKIVKGDYKDRTFSVQFGTASIYHGAIKALQENRDSCYLCGLMRYHGCFSPETAISMADGSTKTAREVAVGDKLFNPVTRKAVTVARVVEGPENVGLVEIKSAEGTLTVSQEHPMLTANGLKQAKDLKAGEKIFNGDNTEIVVEGVKILPVAEGQYVINFLLEGDDMSKSENRMLLANGIVTGDLQTQWDLKANK